MGKLDDAKRAAAEAAARRRATAVGTSPTEEKEDTVLSETDEEYDTRRAFELEAVSLARRGKVHPKTAALDSSAYESVLATGRRMGRPPRAEVASEVVIAVRVTAAENGELVYLANQAELPLSVWAREVLLREAGK